VKGCKKTWSFSLLIIEEILSLMLARLRPDLDDLLEMSQEVFCYHKKNLTIPELSTGYLNRHCIHGDCNS
jgi:hypothetical protein